MTIQARKCSNTIETQSDGDHSWEKNPLAVAIHYGYIDIVSALAACVDVNLFDDTDGINYHSIW